MQIQKLYQFFLKHPIICTDSRKITKGSIFFSLKGENFNGNEFAEKAIIISSADREINEERTDRNQFLTDEVMKFMPFTNS